MDSRGENDCFTRCQNTAWFSSIGRVVALECMRELESILKFKETGKSSEFT